MTKARRTRDDADFKKLYSWLLLRNPFCLADKRLKSLSTGIIGSEKVTCDSADNIGAEIHKKLDNMAMKDAKIKKSDMLVGLASKVNEVNVQSKNVMINPTVLFTRLSALAGREENIEKYFDFELTTYPMSLFKDGMMRKPDKASLRNHLLTEQVNKQPCGVRVVDGGFLLHHLHWPENVTFGELLNHCVASIRSKYGSCHIVFDGYKIPSTKDHEHSRRSIKLKSCDVHFSEEMKVSTKRDDFLSNNNNKSLFISNLARVFQLDGQDVTLSEADADIDIVRVAMQVGKSLN